MQLEMRDLEGQLETLQEGKHALESELLLQNEQKDTLGQKVNG